MFQKQADIYFDWCLQVCLVLFALEVLAAAVVIDDYKYSFFFYLDIVATTSLIVDIPWLLNLLVLLVGNQSLYLSADAIDGVMY